MMFHSLCSNLFEYKIIIEGDLDYFSEC